MKTVFNRKNMMRIMGELQINVNKISMERMKTSKSELFRSVVGIRGLVVCLVALISCVSVIAQEIEYKKVLTEGKRWEYESDHLLGSPESWIGVKYSAEVIGDTIVYSKEAKKLLVKWEMPDMEWCKDRPKTGERVEVFIEENGKIYQQFDHYEEVFMDMNYENNWLYMCYSIVHEDFIESPMGKLKRIFFNEAQDWRDIYRPLGMIEGVGTSNTYVTPDFDMTDGHYYDRMTAFYYNDELLFTEEDFRIIPSGTLEIEPEKNMLEEENTPYYDLMGRVVKKPVPGSILIHQGRKIIYKN